MAELYSSLSNVLRNNPSTISQIEDTMYLLSALMFVDDPLLNDSGFNDEAEEEYENNLLNVTLSEGEKSDEEHLANFPPNETVKDSSSSTNDSLDELVPPDLPVNETVDPNADISDESLPIITGVFTEYTKIQISNLLEEIYSPERMVARNTLRDINKTLNYQNGPIYDNEPMSLAVQRLFVLIVHGRHPWADLSPGPRIIQEFWKSLTFKSGESTFLDLSSGIGSVIFSARIILNPKLTVGIEQNSIVYKEAKKFQQTHVFDNLQILCQSPLDYDIKQTHIYIFDVDRQVDTMDTYDVWLENKRKLFKKIAASNFVLLMCYTEEKLMEKYKLSQYFELITSILMVLSIGGKNEKVYIYKKKAMVKKTKEVKEDVEDASGSSDTAESEKGDSDKTQIWVDSPVRTVSFTPGDLSPGEEKTSSHEPDKRVSTLLSPPSALNTGLELNEASFMRGVIHGFGGGVKRIFDNGREVSPIQKPVRYYSIFNTHKVLTPKVLTPEVVTPKVLTPEVVNESKQEISGNVESSGYDPTPPQNPRVLFGDDEDKEDEVEEGYISNSSQVISSPQGQVEVLLDFDQVLKSTGESVKYTPEDAKKILDNIYKAFNTEPLTTRRTRSIGNPKEGVLSRKSMNTFCDILLNGDKKEWNGFFKTHLIFTPMMSTFLDINCGFGLRLFHAKVVITPNVATGIALTQDTYEYCLRVIKQNDLIVDMINESKNVNLDNDSFSHTHIHCFNIGYSDKQNESLFNRVAANEYVLFMCYTSPVEFKKKGYTEELDFVPQGFIPLNSEDHNMPTYQLYFYSKATPEDKEVARKKRKEYIANLTKKEDALLNNMAKIGEGGVIIKPSTFENIGNGVFADRPFKEGEYITEYQVIGDPFNHTEYELRKKSNNTSYMIQIAGFDENENKVYVDGGITKIDGKYVLIKPVDGMGAGAWVNSVSRKLSKKGKGKSVLVVNDEDKTITKKQRLKIKIPPGIVAKSMQNANIITVHDGRIVLKATKDIEKGKEVFTDYGENYSTS